MSSTAKLTAEQIEKLVNAGIAFDAYYADAEE